MISSTEEIQTTVEIETKKPTKRKNKEQSKVYTSKIDIDGKLFEEVKRNDKAYFIDKNGKYYKHIENYYPIEGDIFHKKSGINLVHEFEDYGTIKELVNELKEFIHQYVDISPFFETISAYYILLSYIHDKFHTVPYLRVLGDYGTGKTRYLDVVGKLCYKSLLTTGTTNAPGMFRFIEQWRGTLVIDEARTKFSGEDDDVTKILNAGFEQGRSIMRVDLNKQVSEQVGLFEPYGTKIIATKRRFEDNGLESRCITEIMSDTGRDDILITLNKNFFEAIDILKKKLLKFRFDNYNNEYNLVNKEIKEINIENRLKQSLSAFFILLKGTDVFDSFVNFAKEYNQEIVRRNVQSYEGVITMSIFSKLRSIKGLRLLRLLCLKELNNNKRKREKEKMTVSHNSLNSRNSLNSLNDEIIITANDILTYIKRIDGFETVSQMSLGLKLNDMKIKRITKNIKGRTVKFLDLNPEQLSRLFSKYIPEENMIENIEKEHDIEIELENEK